MQITDSIIEQFREFFPGLAAYDNPSIASALNEGDAETGSTRWGAYSPDEVTIKQRGMFYFGAHWLITNMPNACSPSINDGAAKNQVASKSVGDESVSYSINTDGIKGVDAWLYSTSYGQQFARLRKRVGMGAIAV